MVSRDAPKALFVIDTGAQVSIINKKLYDSIPAYDKPELKKTDGHLTTIAKNPVRTYGIVQLQLNIQGARMQHWFFVSDINESGIIGIDLLKAQNAVIDLAHDRVLFNHKQVRVSDYKGETIQSRVLARTTLEIPPGAEYVMPCNILKRDRDKVRQCRRTLMFEPNRNTFRRSGAMVARVIVDSKCEQVPVRIFNPCECPITVRKGDPVGRLEVATSIKHESSTCMSPTPSPGDTPPSSSSSMHVETNSQTDRSAAPNPPQSHNVPLPTYPHTNPLPTFEPAPTYPIAYPST